MKRKKEINKKTPSPKAPEPQSPPRLNPKQQKFCTEYLVDLNATQAAIRAGYSPRTAGSQAFDLLKKPEIQAFIDSTRAELAAKTGVTPERVLRELERIAFVDTRRIVRYERGSVRLTPSAELTEDEAAVISELSQRGDGSIRVKFYSRLDALEKIGRHLGMWRGEKSADDGDTERPSGFVGSYEKLLLKIERFVEGR